MKYILSLLILTACAGGVMAKERITKWTENEIEIRQNAKTSHDYMFQVKMDTGTGPVDRPPTPEEMAKRQGLIVASTPSYSPERASTATATLGDIYALIRYVADIEKVQDAHDLYVGKVLMDMQRQIDSWMRVQRIHNERFDNLANWNRKLEAKIKALEDRLAVSSETFVQFDSFVEWLDGSPVLTDSDWSHKAKTNIEWGLDGNGYVVWRKK